MGRCVIAMVATLGFILTINTWAADKPTLPEPKFKMTAEEFAREGLDSIKPAEAKYKGQVIELTGIVARVAIDSTAKPRIVLKTTMNSTLPVDCRTVDPQPWATLAMGQTVTVRGRWPKETPVNPELEDCEVVQAGPSTAVTIKPEELAAEFKKDRAATLKKYNGKSIIMTGEIAKMDLGNPNKLVNYMEFVLKGDVSCSFRDFGGYHAKSATGLKEGSTLTLVGEFDANAQEDNGPVSLVLCHLIKK